MNRLLRGTLLLGLAGVLACAAIARVEGKFDSGTRAKLDKCDEFLKYDVDPREERAIGGALAVGMVAQNHGLLFAGAKVSPNDPLNTYVNEVGRNLALLSGRPDLDWTFAVLDTPEVNAFSTPGGYVFVSRGLLAKLHSEAALAGVLGHEISHVVLKHALEKYKHVKSDACAAAITKAQAHTYGSAAIQGAGDALGNMVSSFTGAFGAPSGFIDLNNHLNFDALFDLTDKLEAVVGLGFDRDQEYEADKMGLTLAIEAGYNPKPYIAFIGSLPDDGSGVFGHHPPSAERATRLAQWPDWVGADKNNPLLTKKDVEAYPTVELDQRISAATTP